MRTVLIFLMPLILSIPINAQMETIYIWPHKVPNENVSKHEPVQTTNTKGNVIRLTDVTNPAFKVFKPEPTLVNGLGVIVCPGGGYQILAMDLEGYEIAKWLNGLGITAFVLQYRVPNNEEGALMDLQRTIKTIRNKASIWQVNPNKLGVLGFSAGASLAARVSTNFYQQSYEKIDEIDDLSSRPSFSLLIYPAYLDRGENRKLTQELKIDNQTPPMFIFATADDPHANSSLVMATSLRDMNIPVELHLLPNGGHGYGLRKGNVAAETWPALAVNWLDNIIRN